MAVDTGPSKPGSAQQPEPLLDGAGTKILPLVIVDLWARDAAGRVQYGTSLKADNGRDALIDAYQEALDLAMYLRQEIEQRYTRKPMAAREAMYELLLGLGDAEAIMAAPYLPPDPIADGDAALLYHGRRKLAILMLDYKRLLKLEGERT